MKIKSIHKIENIRNLLNFEDNQILSKKRNIIYAPNGAGKTNLSRALYALTLQGQERADYFRELKSLEVKNDTFASPGIRLEDFDNRIITQNSIEDKILVFNSDFIEKTIRSSDFSQKFDGQLEGVALGESQIKLVDLERKKNNKIEEGKKIKEYFEGVFTEEIEKIKKFDKGAKSDGLHIRLLKYENLEENIIGEYKNFEGEYTTAREKFEAIKILDPEKDKLINNNREVLIDVDFDWIKTNLSKRVIFGAEADDELLQHIKKLTNDWIENGLSFCDRINDDRCPFCRLQLNAFAQGVIEKYHSHIRSERAKFQKKIDGEVFKIKILKNNLEKLNNNLQINFEKRISDLGLSNIWESIETCDILNGLDNITAWLEDKNDHPLNIPKELLILNDDGEVVSYYSDNIQELLVGLSDVLSKNQKSIDLINDKLRSVGVRQGELRTLIGKRILVEIYEYNDEKIKRRNQLRSEVDDLRQQILIETTKLPNAQIADKVKEAFNFLLNRRLGIEKYSAELDDRFIYLKLNTHNISKETKKISEGEKTAISFCYFLASSIQKRNSLAKFSETVFVFDDPISSMSYSYFYAVGRIVKNFFNDMKDICWNSSRGVEAPQIILLTHNIQFYNFLGAQLFKSENNEDIKYFELEKTEEKLYFRNIKKGEKMSEFHTALRRVDGFNKGLMVENIGNDIRRILETLCSFRAIKFDSDGVGELFGGNDIAPELLAFAHDKSHADFNEYEDPNLDGYKKAARNLIVLMEKDYKKLIDSLSDYEK